MKSLIQTIIIGSLATTALAVPSAMAADIDKPEAQAKKSKKPKKITDRRHPDYVRCRSEPVIGSLTRKKRICMTNAQWVKFTRSGSRDANQFVQDMQSGLSGNN
ncbi:hypothetical protein AZE99_11290 [Sphingorhabdus sp. M41]|nr:hypothetical protein AZE99_11290 [Sphingorhabdus sp. M41]